MEGLALAMGWNLAGRAQSSRKKVAGHRPSPPACQIVISRGVSANARPRNEKRGAFRGPPSGIGATWAAPVYATLRCGRSLAAGERGVDRGLERWVRLRALQQLAVDEERRRTDARAGL